MTTGMDMAKVPSNQIDDEAAAWAARCDAGELDAAERLAFDAWIGEDRRRLGAFARAQAVLARMERVQALRGAPVHEGLAQVREPEAEVVAHAAHATRAADAASPAAWAPAPAAWPRRRFGGRLALVGGAAGLALLLSTWVGSPPPLQTVKGEVRLLPLPDGSTMTMNTSSSLHARFNERERVVELERGEVLFDVAKDRARPFLVRAGSTTVRAVGTSFTVRHAPGSAVRVVVREGVVEISNERLARPVRTVGTQLVELTPSRAGQAPAAVVQRSLDAREVARQLSWREGMLSFEGVTLAEAAAEFERYSDLRIVVVEPELSRAAITGLFAANNPRGFATAAAAAMNARVSEHGQELRLSRR